ncbi:MAG: tetratricopeptide repeat protein [Nitrospirae bacterium]|nr:MAG: tetratricopeptide repeat protein [Nitrospirota bacterium]
MLFLSMASFVYAGGMETLIGRAEALIERGDYGRALAILKEIEKEEPESFEIKYNLGLSYLGLSKYSEAENAFKRALEINPSIEETYLQMGRLFAMKGECDKAEGYLQRFLKDSEDIALKGIATELIERCKKGEKPYYLSVEIGGQYDSNIVLEPTKPIVKSDKKSDYRAFLVLNGGINHSITESVLFYADYQFYQSQHKAVHDYDLRAHNLSLGADLLVTDTISTGIEYSFNYATVGEELYSRYHSITGSISVQWMDPLRQDVYYTYKKNRYWDSPLFAGNSSRSGDENRAGTSFVYQWKGGGITFDAYRTWVGAEKGFWEYDGYGASGSVSIGKGRLSLMIGADYEVEDYKNNFPGQTRNREDRRQRYFGEVQYKISRSLTLVGGDSYTYNDSNINIFEYKRNVVSLIMRWKIL